MRLLIPQPCQEKWESFPKQGNKGYCSVCQSKVTDYTHLTAQQAKAEIKARIDAGETNLCGRFRKEQLDVPKPPLFLPFRKIPVILAASLAITLVYTDSDGRPVQIPVTQERPVMAIGHHTEVTDSILLQGRVLEDSVNGLPGCIIIASTPDARVADTVSEFDGTFSMMIPRHTSTLTFQNVGFEDKVIPVQNTDTDFGQLVLTQSRSLLNEQVIMGGISIRAPFYKRWWYGIKRLFGRY
ncbi:hypothetical protein AB9P05_01380 [Roseivirga sp. BDSF3-8]|uniref:hypothetical protein n=1 Tax=Roseivirga sp. BDSF3-8 TaxID=3241598 RepID=UPI0035325B73